MHWPPLATRRAAFHFCAASSQLQIRVASGFDWRISICNWRVASTRGRCCELQRIECSASLLEYRLFAVGTKWHTAHYEAAFEIAIEVEAADGATDQRPLFIHFLQYHAIFAIVRQANKMIITFQPVESHAMSLSGFASLIAASVAVASIALFSIAGCWVLGAPIATASATHSGITGIMALRCGSFVPLSSLLFLHSP